MARPKKDGRRATGIQGKSGYLYMVVSQPVIKDGVKKSEKRWITTGLPDTPENVKKASEARARLLNREAVTTIDHNITFEDFADYVLDKKKREVTDTTFSAYFYRTKRIKDSFRAVRVRDISEVMVEKFLDSLFRKHKAQPRTVKDIKILFGNIMDQAVKAGIIAFNPVKEVVINKNLANQYTKDRKTDEEFFSYEEAQLFLNKSSEHELHELFYITLFFGLRREEVLGLRWSAIDFKNKTMKINHTVTKGTAIVRANATKTASSDREYPLTDEQIEMFREIRKREKTYRDLFGGEYIDNDYVFKHQDGSLYYPDYPTKAFRKLIKKNPELPQNITFHGLRSSCVSILVHEGMDVKSIQKWVGHADIDTTLRIYAKVKDKETKMEVSNRMTSLLSLKKEKKE